MKKIVFLIIAFAATISCVSKTKSTPSDAASTKESEVSGSQNNVAAVVKQVNAIYDYWNDLKDGPTTATKGQSVRTIFRSSFSQMVWLR